MGMIETARSKVAKAEIAKNRKWRNINSRVGASMAQIKARSSEVAENKWGRG